MDSPNAGGRNRPTLAVSRRKVLQGVCSTFAGNRGRMRRIGKTLGLGPTSSLPTIEMRSQYRQENITERLFLPFCVHKHFDGQRQLERNRLWRLHTVSVHC